MKSIHGIAITEDDQYTMVSFAQRNQVWRINGIRTWNTHNRIGTFMLLGKGVALGIPSSWRLRVQGDDTANLIMAHSAGATTPYALTAQHTLHSETLAGNLLSVVPDDAFLATIPLAMIRDCPASFVSIHRNGSVCRIGLITQRRLTAVFVFSPADDAAVNAHLARIQRYLTLQRSGEPFPPVVCVIGDPITGLQVPGKIMMVPAEALDFTRGKPALLKAAGIALARSCEGTVPQFSGQSSAASGRFMRGIVYAVSAVVLCATVLGMVGIQGADRLTSAATTREHTRYQTIVSRNADIRVMADSNVAVANRILRLNETFFRQTQWALFLQRLGAMRPTGLFIEQLGTEPLAAAPGDMKVALSGRASGDGVVADFIARLQKEPLLADVSLASIEHRQGKGGECGYRIFFILKVTRS